MSNVIADNTLLYIVQNIILNNEYNINNHLSLDILDQLYPWIVLQSTVFVTAYFDKPYISQNVWCCMSNGKYETNESVLMNTINSAKICATRDDRTISAPNRPKYF